MVVEEDAVVKPFSVAVVSVLYVTVTLFVEECTVSVAAPLATVAL